MTAETVTGLKQRKSIKDFSWKFGLKLAAMIGAIGAVTVYVGERYTVGLDTQTNRCLPEWIYIIDTWDRPAASEVEKDDYIAVVLTDAQIPKNALWKSGQVMVKRAMATKPGDHVSITKDGVQFERDGVKWTHGTALEAAKLLGHTEDDYVRSITLKDGELFLMGDNPMSYDGRYYGAANENQILGRVLWAF